MTPKRFTTSTRFDPSITQKVRTALYDGGHADLVNEIIIDGMRDVEQMSRSGLSDHERRIVMLEHDARERLTKTTVIELIKAKAAHDTQGWVKWGTRAMLAGLGTAALTVFGLLIKFAWKGFNS